MNVLIIGNGGREHALAWKIAQSPRAERVFVAPGNAGTDLDGENVPIAADNIPALIKFAKENQVGLTVVGPEAPLAAGIVDAFEEAGLRIFGPSKAAAELEGSKVFCKDLLRSADVPTADYQTFRNADDAIKFLDDREDVPVVVKADGLAAGKGVMVCSRREEAIAAVEAIARQKVFGAAGDRLVIEERLDGQEASVLAITDGRTIVTLQPAQDHKPAYDGDIGPNTGGMGAYCPAPLVDDEMLALGRGAHPRAHGPRHEAAAAAVPRRALRRADDDQPGPEGAGVQRPLRRSGVPAAVDAAEDRPARRAGGRRRPAAGPDSAAGVGPAAGGVRGHGRPRDIPGQYTQGPCDPRPGGGRQAARREGLPRRHGPGDDGRVVTAGGRVLGVTALGDDDRQGQAQRLSRREVHPLGRRLVPQGHLRQGDGK